MADRFEEMAREMARAMGWSFSEIDFLFVAKVIRAESKRAQEAMREQCAKWHEEQIERVKRDWPYRICPKIIQTARS